jgi:hypothetical protein
MCRRWAEAIGTASVLLVMGAAVAAAQTPAATAPASPAYKAARTPDGQPDIQGLWDSKGSIAGTSIECGYDSNLGVGHHENFEPPAQGKSQRSLDAAIKAYGGPSNPCGADGGHDYGSTYYGMALPMQPWARAKKDAIFNKLYRSNAGATSVQELDSVARCLPGGLNRHGRGMRYILQPPGQVVIMDENFWRHRVITLNSRPQTSESVQLWSGDSRGHWEGQTLIVETRNFNDKTWLDSAATIHSDALRTTERFTIVDAGTIKYEITIDDPKVFTKPFTLSNLSVRAAKGDEILESECLEGNRLENYGIGQSGK